MTDRSDPLIGTTIGRYVIHSKLAEGGMGAVYTAQHSRLSTRKVVKVLLAEYSRNEIIRQRFEREATAASRLRHRSIITIDDFGALPDGQLFLMMPFLDGKPLDAHIREHAPLTLHQALLITLQLCSALVALHDAGIVHRDLKPGTVFITHHAHPYEVTLIDLGIARVVAEEAGAYKTETGMAMGTPGYMAVEQYGNAASATPAADLYAVAIIVWEMLTGQLPWGVHDPRVLYHLQMTERPQPPAGHAIPADVLSLLWKTLSPRPELRPLSARDFAISMASITAAIPPHLPSGAEILVRFTPEFAQHAAPHLETVRNAAAAEHANQLAPMAWPYRTTAPSSRLPNLPNVIPIVGAPPATPAVPATVNARPPLGAPPPTTLAAASGVSSPIERPRSRRRNLVAIGVVGCMIAAGATFATLRGRDRADDQTPPSDDRREPATATITQPATIKPGPSGAGLDAPSLPSPVDAGSVAVTVGLDATGVALPIDAGSVAVIVDAPVRADASTTAVTATKPRTGQKKKPGNGSASSRGSAATIDPDAVEE